MINKKIQNKTKKVLPNMQLALKYDMHVEMLSAMRRENKGFFIPSVVPMTSTCDWYGM